MALQYLLIRPAPSLRILFTSPSLRVPGILQSPFLNRIGGSPRVRADLSAALGEGRGVTAKIRWLTKADEEGDGEGRPRWIHCTPLLGHSGAVGVWMIVLVDEEGARSGGMDGQGRRFRQAPVVSSNINGKEWDAGFAAAPGAAPKGTSRGNLNNVYDAEERRRGGMASSERFAYHGVSRDQQGGGRQQQQQQGGDRRGRSTSVYSSGGSVGRSGGDPSEFSFQLK